jgi:hypothetical protein
VRFRIVLQLAVFYGSVIALAAVAQQDAGTAIPGNGETDSIAVARGRNLLAAAGVAQIAEILQFGICGRGALAGGSAAAGKSGAQGQAVGKGPANLVGFLDGEKIRTGHSTHILVRIAAVVLDFFLMTEPNRLETLQQFLEQNPNDAFARYGLAMEYSKAGHTETALQQFAKLLELHPDYTSGYFMAAQTLAKVERNDEAKVMLQKGIESAKRTGNRHALNEMSAMLEELG